ncbi:MAG TPA: fibronectin type III domain-containing protein [Nitrospira sp.]|nr:fibronectin type III domain-containing protein [Nitrospira sp.]
MRQNIRQLLLFPVGFCIASTLFQPMGLSIPIALAAANEQTVQAESPRSRLLSGMPTLKRLVTPPNRSTSPTPAIALNSPGFSFSVQRGNSLPPSQTLIVSNKGGGTLNWNATTDAAWLTLSPAAGSGTGNVTISPASSSVSVGTHTGTIRLSAPGAQPVSIPVTFTVTPPPVPPAIGVSAPNFSFTAQQSGNNPAAQLLSIRNAGGGTLNWTASDNAPWLTLSSTAGTGNGTVTITPVLGSLSVGTHTGTITLTALGAQPVLIPITFNVTPQPISIALGPSSLIYSGVSGGPNPASQSVTVTANGTWTASVNTAWIKLSTNSGSGNGTIIASVNLGSVSGTTNTGTITVTAGNITRTVDVTLKLSAGSLTLSSNSLTFTATKDSADPAPQNLIVNSNASWTATTTGAAPWLSVNQTSGASNGTITARVNTSKAVLGENRATVSVTSGGTTKTVTIILTLNSPSSSSAVLTWRANSETDLAGYKVYRSTIPGKYEQKDAIVMVKANITTHQVTGLQFGKTYYFVVTAFDIAGNESGYSNEVSKSIY